MNHRQRERLVLSGLLLLGAIVFSMGLAWGLPSRSVDPYLFGDHPVWSGAEILKLAGDRDDSKIAADVARIPATRGSVLNETDSQRAQIIRRYRLFTYQPDEMITMMALASMKPGKRDFDPKMYQYGGLWIYPVGAMIKLLAHPMGQEQYLDHPELFGKFYILARMYSALWALIGVWAVFRLARNAEATLAVSAAAAALYIFLPVVVDLSHEAKPHLPGAVLILLAALAAEKFVLVGKKWWILTAVLCGAAAGMVLSDAIGFVILPAMILMRPRGQRSVLILLTAGLIGVAVYFLTNPYMLIGDRAILHSNFSNTAAMYQVGHLWEGLINAGKLIGEGATPVVVWVGVLGLVLVMRGNAKVGTIGLRLLVIVSVIIVIQFILLAAGKPGEYGRFAVLPDITMAILGVELLGRAKSGKTAAIVLLILLAVFPSAMYLRGFLRDSGPQTRRLEYADVLAKLHLSGANSLAVYDEPAPYLLPPVNLFEWKIQLLPKEFDLSSGGTPADVIVRPVDRLTPSQTVRGGYEQISPVTFADKFPSQISWADKPIEIWVRRDFKSAQ